jgi:hypothetical protein
VLKTCAEQPEDDRRDIDGKPLRQTWPVPILPNFAAEHPTITKSNKESYLCEAQLSVAVTGFDDSVWTAYCCVDTYFGTRDSVGRYHQMKGRKGRGRADPFARGLIDADTPIWAPREYFMKILEIRIKEARTEWRNITDMIEKIVKECVQMPLL